MFIKIKKVYPCAFSAYEKLDIEEVKYQYDFLNKDLVGIIERSFNHDDSGLTVFIFKIVGCEDVLCIDDREYIEEMFNIKF